MSFSVIIPSRTDSNLHACVDAIREMGETCRVIVVDDGLKDRRADCEYVQGISPFCFSRNINLGIVAAGSDDVILANDDTKLKTPMGFTRMVEESLRCPSLGIVSPAVNNTGNTNQHPRGLGMRLEPRMICFITAFVPRSTIDLVGMLDERFLMYGLDDDDYCFRVRAAGLKIGILDSVFVDHSELVSTFRGGPEAGGDFKPNLRIFIDKWGHDNRGLPKEQSPWRELFA